MFAVVVEPEFGITRDELARRLRVAGIETRTFFCPMNRQPCLARPGHKMPPCPVADRLWESGLYLPSSINLSAETITTVCSAIRQAARPTARERAA
jgi:perosamine synthetase